jgi:membrane-associated phospholipid phosphatase
MSRLLVAADGRHRLGGAVPSPAGAFLLTLIVLPSLFWLVTLKRETDHTNPEEWLMAEIVPRVQDWVSHTVAPVHSLLIGISGLGSGWFVAIGFALLGLLALVKRRSDLALLLAAGTLAFPMEWALKYFTAIPTISPATLGSAMLNINGIGLDDIADFPAGHALRATVFYGLAAFCVARLAPDRRQGLTAYGVAMVLIASISLTRIYLGAHFPVDVLGGWMAGAALLSVIVAVHVLGVDERLRAAAEQEAAAALAAQQAGELTLPRRVAVRLRHRDGG